MARVMPEEHYKIMSLSQLIFGLTESGYIAGQRGSWYQEAREYIQDITDEIERRIEEAPIASPRLS